MKAIYTTLFLADSVLMLLLAYSLLNMIDHGIHPGQLVIMLLCIIICISFLIFLLRLYLKNPTDENKKRNKG